MDHQQLMYYTKPLGMVLYVLLIIGFTFFYTFVQINPVQMADQMKKNGGYIPGIRPGKPTSTYLTRVMTRITLAGAIFLAVISILASVLRRLGRFAEFGSDWGYFASYRHRRCA